MAGSGQFLWRNTRVAAVFLVMVSGGAWAALAVTHRYDVSEKDQIFAPADLGIQRGDTVRIVNDDDVAFHHLYVHSKQFSFDAPDEGPGAKLDIIFPKPGTYQVLCGIHPAMKLVVRVR